MTELLRRDPRVRWIAIAAAIAFVAGLSIQSVRAGAPVRTASPRLGADGREAALASAPSSVPRLRGVRIPALRAPRRHAGHRRSTPAPRPAAAVTSTAAPPTTATPTPTPTATPAPTIASAPVAATPAAPMATPAPAPVSHTAPRPARTPAPGPTFDSSG